MDRLRLHLVSYNWWPDRSHIQLRLVSTHFAPQPWGPLKWHSSCTVQMIISVLQSS